MENNLIFIPVVSQIALTFVIYFRLTLVKYRALKNSEVNHERRALHDDAWPDSVLKVSNNLQNQFESPVIFYSLCFIFWALNAVTLNILILAWSFVFLRVLHAVIHTGQNKTPLRKRVFMASTILLMILFGCVSIELLYTN